MFSLFEVTCYCIGFTTAVATLFCHGKLSTFTRNNQKLQTACADVCCDLNKRITFRKVITFIGLWTALIGVGIAES